MNVFFLRNYTNWLSDGVLDLSLTNGVNAISLNLLFSHELVFFSQGILYYLAHALTLKIRIKMKNVQKCLSDIPIQCASEEF